MLDLGDKVKDKLTEYAGIVISRTAWVNGCARLGVQSAELKDGKPVDQVVFDENQLELIEKGVYPSDQRVEIVAARELGMIAGKGSEDTRRQVPGGPRPDVRPARDIEK